MSPHLRKAAIRLIEIVLAIVFLSAAVHKAVFAESFRTILSAQIPQIERWSIASIVLTAAIVAIEAGIAIALFCRVAVRGVSIGAIVLLVIFTVILATLIARDLASIPCGCGTIIELGPREGIVRNILLITGFGLLAFMEHRRSTNIALD